MHADRGCKPYSCYWPDANQCDFAHIDGGTLQVACCALADELSDHLLEHRQIYCAMVLDDCELYYPEVRVFERRQDSIDVNKEAV